ncbi:MAG TPA: vitamin K epoxide reductase family protein [Vicinamibacterales bacterium]|nr:vitamin K epoxide reductase family protein [Vicinamibacterales bacterium]
MSKRASVFALVCALVGFGASAAAAYTHYHILFDPAYRSFCDINETWSCTQVYQTRYSTFQGIPVALFSGMWFAVAALLSVSALRARDSIRESVPGYLFVMSTLALAVVIYMAYISFAIIKVKCILCVTIYASVVGLFLVSGGASSIPMTTLPRRATRDLRVLVTTPLAIVIAILFFVGAGTTLAFFPRESVVAASSGEAAAAATAPIDQDRRSEFERYFLAQPRVPLMVPNEGAKVLIVKFNDFQCPACGQSYLQYKPILAKFEAEHPGQVKMVLKDYPLNPACNPNVSAMLHPAACEAAVAVRLAAQHNKADALEDYLYTHQPQMTPPMVRQAAHDIGGVNDFDAKYESTLALVKGETGLGKQLNVSQTPTFFVDGVKLEGMIAPQYFQQAIEIELARAK